MVQKLLKQTGEAEQVSVRVVSGTVNGIAAAGTTTLTTLLKSIYGPTTKLRQVHINGAYVGGPNGSFKAQAGGGKKLSLIFNVREVGGGAFRRDNSDTGDYVLRPSDVTDILEAPNSELSFSEDLQIQVNLDKNPSNPFDLQWWAEVEVP